MKKRKKIKKYWGKIDIDFPEYMKRKLSLNRGATVEQIEKLNEEIDKIFKVPKLRGE